MKLATRTLTIVALVGLNSCTLSKVMILQAPVMSMKGTDTGGATVLQGGKTVNEKWCYDEPPVQPNDDGSKHYGMIDQVTWKAHKSTNATFFKDAKYYTQGGCVLMTAEAATPKGG